MLKLFVLKPEMIQLDMEYTFLIDMYGYKNPKRNMIMNVLNNYLIGETKIEYYIKRTFNIKVYRTETCIVSPLTRHKILL